MSKHEPDDAELDQAFERALVEAARGEGPSRDATQAAWNRFVFDLSNAAMLGHTASTATPPRRAAMKVASTWALIGAAAGSLITAAVFGFAAAPRPFPARPQNELRTAASAAPSSALAIGSPVAGDPVAARAPAADPVVVTNPPPSAAPFSSRRMPPAPRRSRAARETNASTLAAEVSLLDAARSAYAAGADDEALRLIDEYRSRFSRGELAADAEVVAIDALLDKGESAAAASLSRSFLAQHPNDPHAPHIQAVLERESSFR